MLVGLHRREHVLGDRFASGSPSIENLVVAFLSGHHPLEVVLLERHNLLVRIGNVPSLGVRGDEVVGAEGQSAVGRFAEPELVHVVEQLDRRAPA